MPSSKSEASFVPEKLHLLAVIPARGGSKRLPRKNVLALAGKPLIGWTIDSALASGLFDEVLVSTDDEEIADASRRCGATVPWLRPADLSTDTARSIDVVRHAAAWYAESGRPLDVVVLLQPTSPFRRVQSLRRAVEAFVDRGSDRPLVSMSPASPHPAWCFMLNEDRMTPFVDWSGIAHRSQDLTPAYALNGAIYIFPMQLLREERPWLTADTIGFVMEDQEESHDIDTPMDWQIATSIAERLAADRGGPRR